MVLPTTSNSPRPTIFLTIVGLCRVADPLSPSDNADGNAPPTGSFLHVLGKWRGPTISSAFPRSDFIMRAL
ncbi:hypothetical protein P691DRAFT_809563 [Macrolepiota fuliginosa MF-IS2]|uniref:Uncharacterized protein n=1 Tax=Macrolepiota fuliginosa MF-IS2 TaxID=1400762 RepID=A0A9P6C6W2_9AGAR|nr:hypothetical protein P691DRAFT_809563 [Macrolepiota fuliginosa MF-IS2]